MIDEIIAWLTGDVFYFLILIAVIFIIAIAFGIKAKQIWKKFKES